MATLPEHAHHLRIRSTQMEMPPANQADRAEDYDRKLKDAHEELERIQQQREELERKKLELEELKSRKHAFVSQQVELTEKLTSSITLIDRELFELRNEAEDIEQCRTCFATHLDKIQKFNPENWTRENLAEKLGRATMALDLATDEFEQAAAYFEGSRGGAIFGQPSKRGRAHKRHATASEFMANLRNGFAFNLSVLVLGGAALLIYLLK
jgi:chromosome segregation ATPase